MYNHDKFMMYLCIGGSVLSPNSSLYGPLNQSSYSNLTCPVNAADTRNCTAMLSTNPLCMNGSKDLVIQCSRPLTMTMTSTIMGKILNHRSVLFLPFFLFAATYTTMTTASSSSTTVTAITSSTSSSRIATSTSPTPSTSNAPSSTINIRFIVSIATGGAVFVLTVLVVVAVLIIVTCLYIRNARRKSRREKSQKPVELKGYND